MLRGKWAVVISFVLLIAGVIGAATATDTPAGIDLLFFLLVLSGYAILVLALCVKSRPGGGKER